MKIFPSILYEREHLGICLVALCELQLKYPHTNMSPCVGNFFIYKWCHNCARQRMVLKAFWCLAGGRTQRQHVCTILLTGVGQSRQPVPHVPLAPSRQVPDRPRVQGVGQGNSLQ